MKGQEKLEKLSLYLDGTVYETISNYIHNNSNKNKVIILNFLKIYIEILTDTFKTNNVDDWVRNLTYIRTDISQNHTFITSKKYYGKLLHLIRYMMIENLFREVEPEKLVALVTTQLSQNQYNICKLEVIPKEVSDKFSHTASAEEIFNNTLSTTCTSAIAKRLKEHVNSFKNKKHHRAPLINFLKQIYESKKTWNKHPNIIQGELIKFRSNMLDNLQRNTAYNCFQCVKNAISVLLEHDLLPISTVLPNNLRRCTNTQKIRKDNPLISKINLYDKTKKQLYIDTPTYIESLKNELSENLNIFVTEAQELVYNGYKKFMAKDSLIERSQFNSFINHHQLLVHKEECDQWLSKIKPFSPNNPLRRENLIAYYDHFLDKFIQNITLHNIKNLNFNADISGYIGLTSSVASAMQIIITEELGINPYSLYRAKISSTNGYEFLQITDEGSVRIKTLKPRARKAHLKNALGSNKSLSDTNAQNIDAATCFKIALEMTSEFRKLSQLNDLWLCISNCGLSAPTPETFQNQFNIIRALPPFKSVAMKSATMKKIRSSKGVLIYLESNGDSLKAATYFGNSVKTTLARYIPQYITELLYRIKIRSFQNIFLFMSIAFEESPSHSLNMSESEFNIQVKRAFNNPDMGGNLYRKLTKPAISSRSEIYFCISARNIELAIQYSKHGENSELKKRCVTVLSKISEGNVIMKQMLRKAQIAVKNGNVRGI